MGRASEYTEELADIICDLMMETSCSLQKLCDDNPAIPAPATIKKWRAKYPSFGAKYARAREMQMESMADEIIEISDYGLNDTYIDDEGDQRTNHDVINRSRLRVDTRKWLMSKLAPRTYGDKITQELTGPGAVTPVINIVTSGTHSIITSEAGISSPKRSE